MRFKVSLFGAALGVIGSYQAAHAQGGGGLEEITVTARRVEENLMQVPLAISAVSASDIENTGVQNLNELVRFTPGVVSTPGTGSGRVGGPFNRGNPNLIFRGLSVATGQTFLDGAPFAGAATPDVTDVARIEVLKGPQSVYFGRSTYSGAVNYVSKDPSDTFGGYVSGDLSSYNTVDVRGSLEGPISDKVGVRVSGHHFTTAGQYPNPLQGDRLGAQRSENISVYAVLKPNDALKVKAYYAWALNDDGVPAEGVMIARKFIPTANPSIITTQATGGELGCNTGGTAGPWYCGVLPTLGTLVAQNPMIISSYDRIDGLTKARLIDNIPVPIAALGNAVQSYPFPFDTHWLEHYGIKVKTQSAHLNLDYETESGWTLGSITAWDGLKSAGIGDYNFRDVSQLPNRFYVSATATPLLGAFESRPALTQSLSYDFSQEVRVSSPANARLRGVAGGSYLRISNPRTSLGGFNQQGTVQNNQTKTLSKTPAVFGALYFDFTDQFTLTAEARYQWDKIYQEALWPLPAAPLQATYTSFSPRVSLDYKFGQDSLVYALYSRGYRPGGFNVSLFSNPPTVIAQLSVAGGKLAYEQEKLDNFEIGVKWTGLDNRLRVIVDGYYGKWKNGQVTQSIFVTQTNGALAAMSVILNQGAVDLKGLEAEARWATTDKLTLGGTLAYMKNEVKNYLDIVNGPRVYGTNNAAGYELPGAPKLTFSLSADYRDHFMGDWDWFARTDVTYRGGFFIDTHDIAKTAPATRMNLRAGLETGSIRVEGYVNNVFDNDEITEAGIAMDTISANAAQNAIRFIAPTKRQIGLKASYKF